MIRDPENEQIPRKKLDDIQITRMRVQLERVYDNVPFYRKKFDEIASSEPVKCECGGFIRPNVVWFGESLDREILSTAFQKASGTDLCFVIGTSGIVQPAASIPYIAKENGAYIIEINLERTPISSIADFFIAGKAAETLEEMRELFS